MNVLRYLWGCFLEGARDYFYCMFHPTKYIRRESSKIKKDWAR
jgi:hypothetical protein